MSKEITLKSFNILPLIRKYLGKYGKHAAFAGFIGVMVVYIFVVFRINSLANAEPDASEQQVVTTSIPHIDSKAVEQIQSLENNNADIHSLFEQARNNPFSETAQ